MVLTLWVRVNLRAMAMKEYSTLEPHYQMQFSIMLGVPPQHILRAEFIVEYSSHKAKINDKWKRLYLVKYNFKN